VTILYHNRLLLQKKKLRFLMKTFQDFLHIMDFIGNQTVQGPNESFSAPSKGFKQNQTMNKGLKKLGFIKKVFFYKVRGKYFVRMKITTDLSLFLAVSATSLCLTLPPNVFILTHNLLICLFFHAIQVFHKQTGTRSLKT